MTGQLGAVVLSLKEQEYVTAARSVGATNWRIVMRHILPNCLGPIIVETTLGVASAILLEGYLGFLSFGVMTKNPTAEIRGTKEGRNRRAGLSLCSLRGGEFAFQYFISVN